jgi:hypothetical protein
LRNPSTFVIPSAARNPYHLQTRYPVPQVPPRAFRRYPGENLSALPRKGTAPKFGHVRQGHGFSRAKKPRPKVAASLPQADVAMLTTHNSQLMTFQWMPYPYGAPMEWDRSAIDAASPHNSPKGGTC